jgi:hypothetical protein
MLYCRSSQLPEQRLEARRRPPRASLFLISAPTNARGGATYSLRLTALLLTFLEVPWRKLGLDTGYRDAVSTHRRGIDNNSNEAVHTVRRRRSTSTTSGMERVQGTETQSTRPDLRYKLSFRSSFATYSTSADLQVPKNIANPVIIYSFLWSNWVTLTSVWRARTACA